MNIKDIKKFNIPNTPGVYFFLKGKSIIYIGKATSLKDRVKSYFNKDLISMRGPVILEMVFQADKIKWEKTDSVLEALILEAELIKKYQPKYNTKEKSDKSFNYVCFTKSNLRRGVDDLPKVIVVRGRVVQHSVLNKYNKIYGPFPNSTQLKEGLKIIRRIFPFLDDKSKKYYKFYKQVDLVPDISNEEKIKKYKANVKNIELFFQGKKKKLIKDLQKEMMQLAKKHEFEKAGEVKRQIFALKHINDIALIKQDVSQKNAFTQVLGSPVHKSKKEQAQPDHSQKHFSATQDFRGESESIFSEGKTYSTFRIEAYDVAHMSGRNMVGVMTVVEDGEINKNEYRKFKIKTQSGANDTGALGEIIERRLVHTEWNYPNLIVVDGGKAQINAVEKIFKKVGIGIPIVSVLKDEKHKPKDILGRRDLATKYEKEILLANSEAHRFAISYHKQMRGKNFLK